MEPPPLPPDHHLAFSAPSDLQVDDPATASESDHEHVDLNLQKFYHFLMRFSVMQLRRVAKVWDCRQHGLKKAIVARIYLYVMSRVEEHGCTLQEAISINPWLANFENWVTSTRSRVDWEKPPTRNAILKIVGATNFSSTDSGNDVDHENYGKTFSEKMVSPSELSLSEFARLLLLIKDNEQIKRAIFEARREVLPEEEATDRLKFWSSLVEPCFNEKAFAPTLGIDGPFEGVAPARIPGVHRDGSELMNAFGGARQHFLAYLERWRREGSGNPAMFEGVLPRNGRGGNISRIGKRSLMLYKVFRCWDDNQDVLMLGLSARFSAGASIRGTKRSIGAVVRKYPDEDDDTDLGSEIRSTPGSKRRRRTSGRGDDSPDSEEYTKGVLDAMKMIAAGKTMEAKTERHLDKQEEEYAQDIRVRKVREQLGLMKAMEEARRMIRDHQLDDEFKNMAKLFYDELKAEFMSLRK